MLESNSSGDGVFGGSAAPETCCAFFSGCEPTLRSWKTQSEKLRGLGQSPSAARKPLFLLRREISSANRGGRSPSPAIFPRRDQASLAAIPFSLRMESPSPILLQDFRQERVLSPCSVFASRVSISRVARVQYERRACPFSRDVFSRYLQIRFLRWFLWFLSP